MTEARWYFDFGCSRHMTRNSKYLMSIQPSSGSVTFGEGQKGKIVGKGILNVPGLPHLDEVLLVNGLRANLISISQPCDQNWNACFNRDCCSVRDKQQQPQRDPSKNPPKNVWRKEDGAEPSTLNAKKRDHDQISEQDDSEKETEMVPRRQKKHTIHFIYGGPAGGDTPTERRKWSRQLYVGEVVSLPKGKKQRREAITFCDEDLPEGPLPHRDALVIKMDINDMIVHPILADTGSSVNMMYYDAFTKLGLPRGQLKEVRTPLSGFTGDSVETEGSVTLPVEIGTSPNIRKMDMEFIVVRLTCAHNIILGRPALEDLKAIISMEHLCMKFPTPNGIGVVRGDRRAARSCYVKACKKIGSKDLQVHTIAEKIFKKEEAWPRAEPVSETEDIVLDPSRPDRVAKIGTGLSPELRAQIVDVIRRSHTVFAWGPEDMPGIDRRIITHKLAVDPSGKPVHQRKRYMSAERREFVKKEVTALLNVGHIKEIYYPQWLSNVVLAPKGSTWRMCVDYTDLNRACPMDRFPLPNIDQLVDETAGCELMSFMDAFRGYHQISMHEEDAEKTAFITPEGIFCYLVMPFGLKNAGATYTRMVAKLFKSVLGRNMEVYVDDMIVKSRKATSHAEDLSEVFSIMKKFNLRLNPKKCTFAVDGGKFLGFMVTRNGIEPNLEKVRTILDMEPPRSIKEVQRLNGRLAALGRFLSKSAERSLPFFQILKKSKGFEWTPDCQKAFEELKKYLLSPPLLAKPEAGETLILYLGVSQGAISSVLVKEEGGTQRPIYYVSKALHDAELRYSVLEKTVFAIVTSSKRLAHYFQAHPIHVLSHQPLGSFLRNTNSSARMARWAMHLSQFDIDFKPRPAIKGQALADFIVECTAREVADQVETEDGGWWTLSTDGSSNSKGCGGGVVLVTPEGFRAYYAIRFHFKLSNNEAEYEAILNGLRLAAGLRAGKVRIRCDSKLVVSQVSGEYEANEGSMQKYRDAVLRTLREFEGYEIHQVPREQNADADKLSKLSTGVPGHIRKIARLEDLETSSIDVSWVFPVQTREPCWIDHIKRYKADGTLPQDEADAKVTKLRAPSYVVSGDKLYKRSYNGTLLRCLYPDEAKLEIKEVHEGVCSAHQGAYTIARRIMLQGYFWPKMLRDCAEYTKRCPKCQEFQALPGRSATNYTLISTAIPFSRWGIDLVGALPTGTGSRKYIIVAIDYFTKWVEAEPLASITAARCKRFVEKNILYRFGIPLQANGQVENANRTILDGLKKKLEVAGGAWVEELDGILWAYRTTPRRATGETPFALAYGFEARAPVEVIIPSRRVEEFESEQNELHQRVDLNFLDEKREAAFCKMENYGRQLKSYHDAKVRPRYFQVGDLVLRRREASQPLEGGKFAKKWEGPYVVEEVVRPGTYKLRTTGGRMIDRVWNSEHLIKYFP
ncbi:PREDICTED: uncharacterized protein LOC109154680 [Ipomoea nil]|uniref:uncharacterized protein LOC109154680 n=1 Tax=Ipomoea nil TaxID=35883 RepID=UPI000900EBBA|nr:PREDICTED: uncharacterized protein LOC109154680 [Ipomoea nil]